MENHSIAYIHKTYLPQYDRWRGKPKPNHITSREDLPGHVVRTHTLSLMIGSG